MSEATVREVIYRTNGQLCEWYAAGDADSVAGAFAEDCWQMPPHAEPLVGRDALRDFWREAMRWGTWRFTLEAQDVVVSEPIAVERGKYVLEFTAGPDAPPGMASSEDMGNYLVLWRHEPDGEWRIVWDAPSSTAPLPVPAGTSAPEAGGE